MDNDLFTIAKNAFEAYYQSATDGQDMPRFETASRQIQEAWKAAVKSVVIDLHPRIAKLIRQED